MNSTLEGCIGWRCPALISAAWRLFSNSANWLKAVTNSWLLMVCGGMKRPVLLIATRCMGWVSVRRSVQAAVRWQLANRPR